ncbi:hypothetical protein EI555_006530, partial [Monodon monoceros]
ALFYPIYDTAQSLHLSDNVTQRKGRGCSSQGEPSSSGAKGGLRTIRLGKPPQASGQTGRCKGDAGLRREGQGEWEGTQIRVALRACSRLGSRRQTAEPANGRTQSVNFVFARHSQPVCTRFSRVPPSVSGAPFWQHGDEPYLSPSCQNSGGSACPERERAPLPHGIGADETQQTQALNDSTVGDCAARDARRHCRFKHACPLFGIEPMKSSNSRFLFNPCIGSPACPIMSDAAVDTSSEITTKDLKEKKEVVEEAENGREAPANGNAENEENGEQEADNEVDEEEEEGGEEEEEEEEGDGEEEDGDEDEEAEAATGKRAAEDDEDDDVDTKKQKTDEDD